ncbi:MAG: hypothetical protein U0637_14895 [Phycisphaerales bacterium]
MPSPAADGLFVITLLIGSAVVVVFALWLAQVLSLHERLGRRVNDSTAMTRTILGTIALTVSVVHMLGLIPGVPMNTWTMSACAGTALLGICTVVAGYRSSRSSVGMHVPQQDPVVAAQPARKAA